MATNDLNAAIASLAQVKNEHREILQQIASDPGMAPETRASLIAHLYEEEDEHVAEIQALSGGGGGAPSSGGGTSVRPGLTVGSLRSDPGPSQPQNNLSVGSLRA